MKPVYRKTIEMTRSSTTIDSNLNANTDTQSLLMINPVTKTLTTNEPPITSKVTRTNNIFESGSTSTSLFRNYSWFLLYLLNTLILIYTLYFIH